jgi:hypothetical protein
MGAECHMTGEVIYKLKFVIFKGNKPRLHMFQAISITVINYNIYL